MWNDAAAFQDVLKLYFINVIFPHRPNTGPRMGGWKVGAGGARVAGSESETLLDHPDGRTRTPANAR